MSEVSDRVTRFSADLVESALAEGHRQSRSARQQLDHWARVGRAVSSQHSVARQRVEAALSGRLDLSELGVEEGVVFNAEISAAIEENLQKVNYGEVLVNRGQSIVALDDEGNLVELAPAAQSAPVGHPSDRR